MPNIAGVLREEICRLAKKEVKAQVGKTQKAAAQYRRDIAKLKRLGNHGLTPQKTTRARKAGERWV
jgi:hypothetical protein